MHSSPDLVVPAGQLTMTVAVTSHLSVVVLRLEPLGQRASVTQAEWSGRRAKPSGQSHSE